MPTHTLEDELYHLYDIVVGKTLEALINRSPYHDTIRLSGFDRKNQEHLFVLRVALMVRDLYQTPVELAIPWWDGVVVNWKIRKGFNKVKIVNRLAPNNIWVPSLVGKVKAEIRNEYDICIYLDNIYRTYYEGSCG
jgi:hypothetical protein